MLQINIQGFIIEVYLDEWYDNEMEDEIDPDRPFRFLPEPHIEGPAIVHVFDTDLTYSIVGLTNGKFVVSSNKVKINNRLILHVL